MRWSPFTEVVVATLFAAGLGSPRDLFAQRAEENVTTSSDDAFGRSVGNESIGIYNEEDVRDFSPIEAGNVRLEGLYFDRLGSPTSRLVEGSTIRVGIAAQSYPFPSPTGIVDYDLRRVGASQVVSALLQGRAPPSIPRSSTSPARSPTATTRSKCRLARSCTSAAVTGSRCSTSR